MSPRQVEKHLCVLLYEALPRDSSPLWDLCGGRTESAFVVISTLEDVADDEWRQLQSSAEEIIPAFATA